MSYYSPMHKIIDHFKIADALAHGSSPNAPKPFRTFASCTTTSHLATKLHLRMTVNEATTLYQLPDLRSTIHDYLDRCIWTKVRTQVHNYHDPRNVEAVQTMNVFPPSRERPHRLYDSTVFSPTSASDWPSQGLHGHVVAQLRLVFHMLGTDEFLAYVQRFHVINPPAGHTTNTGAAGLHLLKHATRNNGEHEPVTWSIPGMDAQETLEAMLIPIAGAEETDISKWLNMIIDSFSDLRPLAESNSKFFGPAVPEGWDGLCLTWSMTKASVSNLKAVANCRLCSWSSQYATKPVENSHLNIKPDIMFCSQPDVKSGFAWQNVISFLELTASHKVYAVFTSQPARRFVVALSLTYQDFCLHVFDWSGTIHSLAYNIHKSADTFCCLLYVFAFGRPEHLGFNPTCHDPSLSPSRDQQEVEAEATEQAHRARREQEQELQGLAEEETKREHREADKKKARLDDFDDTLIVDNVIAPSPLQVALQRLSPFECVLLWYFSPDGCRDAARNSTFSADDAPGINESLTNTITFEINTKAHKSTLRKPSF
ncbi:hypothetical protein BU15DRAFT_80484 [Melanogaster broomeanus]|nr:hypothetical protein BU15DRAFT_80484 [Melanogaster broomeanus]